MSDSDLYLAILDQVDDGAYAVGPDRKIRYWNRAAERITGYAGGEVLGRCCAEDLLVHVDEQGQNLCRGQCPLAATLKDGQPREARAYLHHREGHRVPVSMRVAPIHDAGGSVVGAIETFKDSSEEISTHRRLHDLERLAYLDPLTELANRRYLEQTIEMRLQEMERYGWPFGVVFADVDRFKAVNDLYGHEAGDRVLRMVARTMARSARPFDVVGRWGGEEFVVAVANVDGDQLRALAERFRSLIAQSHLSIDSHDVRVTASLGATMALLEDTPQTVVARADRLMYQAKQAGRDQVCAD